FRNHDGSVLQSGSVPYGTVPVYAGLRPKKAPTAQYRYTFKGWTPTVAAATADAEYTARFDSTVNVYTVVFSNIDGTVLQRSELAYGETPVYEGPVPTRKGWQGRVFVFKGWSAEIVPVTGAVEYVAQFEDVSAVEPSIARRPAISVQGRVLAIAGLASGTRIQVFGMDGRLLAQETASGPEHRIELANSGRLVVRVGNATFRLNVR
ncbi:MAG: hypothetical protein J6V65_01145, partial [Fibrobacterales bacterium]|nr:hypothetical protein [Fibrobacterales bacterium]